MGATVSIVGTAIVGTIGWLFRLQIASLARALRAVPILLYLWIVALTLIAIWVVAQFTDRSIDLSFQILTCIITVFALLDSISNKRKDKDLE